MSSSSPLVDLFRATQPAHRELFLEKLAQKDDPAIVELHRVLTQLNASLKEIEDV